MASSASLRTIEIAFPHSVFCLFSFWVNSCAPSAARYVGLFSFVFFFFFLFYRNRMHRNSFAGIFRGNGIFGEFFFFWSSWFELKCCRCCLSMHATVAFGNEAFDWMSTCIQCRLIWLMNVVRQMKRKTTAATTQKCEFFPFSRAPAAPLVWHIGTLARARSIPFNFISRLLPKNSNNIQIAAISCGRSFMCLYNYPNCIHIHNWGARARTRPSYRLQ